jgi:hypothetical protein
MKQMKITKKIKKAIVKDPLKLTEREFYMLSELAENEIQEWSMFLVNLHNEYNNGKKINGKGIQQVSKRNIKKSTKIS